MSDDLYYTVLRWADDKGVCKAQGMTVTLREAPDLGAGPVVFLAYRPEIRDLLVQVPADTGLRELTRDEVRAADVLLRSLTTLPPKGTVCVPVTF